MSKVNANCFICGSEFEYDAHYMREVDCDIHGGPICPVCKTKGLQYFLSKKKQALEQKMNLNLQKYANELKDGVLKLKGNWWDKESELYKYFIKKGEENVE